MKEDVSRPKTADTSLQKPAPPKLEVLDKSRMKIIWPPLEESCVHACVLKVYRNGNIETPSTTLYIDRSGTGHEDKQKAQVFMACCEAICKDLEEGPTYRAQVAMKKTDGLLWRKNEWSPSSDLSEPVVIKTPSPPPPPVLTAIGQDSVKVSWMLADLDCKPEALKVAIALKDEDPGIRYVHKNGTLHSDTVPVLDKAAKEVIVKDLKIEVMYKAQIAVQNGVGWSMYSEFCRADKIAKPVQLDPPVLKIVHGDRIEVNWDPPKSGLPCTAYAVALNDGKATLYLDSKGRPHDNKDNVGPIPATQTSILVPKILMNVAYKAQVASQNMLGWGPYSDYSNAEAVTCLKKKESPVVNEDDILVTM